MTRLAEIQETAQYVVHAIASAMDMDVAFIDETANLVAYSRNYLKKRGPEVNQAFVRRVLKKKVVILPDPGFNELCHGCRHEGNCPETAELIRAIEYDNRVIGIILMVAYTREQREKLLGNTSGLMDFIGEMANLVCSEVKLQEILKEEKIIQNELRALVNFVDTGTLTTDARGWITNINLRAEQLLKLKKGDHSRFIEAYLAPADYQPLLAGQSIKRRETAPLLNPGTHCLVSGRPIRMAGKIMGTIISLEDIKQMRSLVYDYSERQVATTLADIRGESPAIRESKAFARRIAQNDSTVLIQGESGTGKELFARFIHSAGGRAASPFIPINCAAIPESLLESELFGYDEGAFSGAKKGGKPGKFEIANGGTLFLDEIGDLPLHMQAKLLRALQERQVERVGGVRPIEVDVRVIAATHRDLMSMQKKGEFREDLYFRLNVMPLSIPPLRERREDIMILSEYFLGKYADRFNRPVPVLSGEARDCLGAYHWPGNARELQNAIEYALNMEKTDTVSRESLPDTVRAARPHISGNTLAARIRRYEASLISETIKKYGNSVEGKARAARELGISLPTLYRKVQSR